MKKIFLIIAVVLMAYTQTFAQAGVLGAFRANYFVASDGSSSNSGKYPWAPITVAKLNTLTLLPGNIVAFKSGDTITGTVVVGQSGTASKPIVYTSYGNGAKPVLSGFTTVSGWTNRGGGIYKKYIATSVAPNMLTISGTHYALGREPDGSNYTWESASTNVSVTDNQMGSSPDWDGAEVVLYKNQYTLDRAIITNHTGTLLAYTSLGTTRNADATGEYFIQNDLRTLDNFGEWYYSSSDTLFVYFGAVNPETVTTKVSTTQSLVTNAAADYVVFKNLQFEGSNTSAIKFESGTTNCTFDNCHIRFSGGDGFTLYGNNNTIQNCSVRNVNGGNNSGVNGGAIYMTGTNAVVKNNTLADIGVMPGQTNMIVYSIAMTLGGDNPTVMYNTIDSSAYMGVYLTIEAETGRVGYNFINDVAMVRPDASGIYLGHEHPGTLVDWNIVSNSGGNGIYLDEYAQGIRVENNTVFGCTGSGIKLHKASSDTLTANTVYNNTRGIDIYNFSETTTDTIFDNVFTDNIVIAATQNQYLYSFTNTNADNDFGESSNYLVRPVNAPALYYMYLTDKNAAYQLDDWQTVTGTDNSSTELVKINGSNYVFYYNATKRATSVAISGTKKDAQGNTHTTSVTLQPFASVFLYTDFTPESPVYAYGNLIQESFEGTGYENTWAETVGANTGNLVDEDNTETTTTGGGSQVLKTSSNTTPTATAAASRASTKYTLSSSQQVVYHGVWVKVASHSLANNASGLLTNIVDASGNQAIEIFVLKKSNGSNVFYVRYYQNGALTTTVTSDIGLITGKWYFVGLKYDITNMRVAAQVNGTSILDAALSGTVRASLQGVNCGHYNSTQAITNYLDLVNLDTATWGNYNF